MGKTLFGVSDIPKRVGKTLFWFTQGNRSFSKYGSFHPHYFGMFFFCPPAGGSAVE
jgi:hypothetical protein